MKGHNCLAQTRLAVCRSIAMSRQHRVLAACGLFACVCCVLLLLTGSDPINLDNAKAITPGMTKMQIDELLRCEGQVLEKRFPRNLSWVGRSARIEVEFDHAGKSSRGRFVPVPPRPLLTKVGVWLGFIG